MAGPYWALDTGSVPETARLEFWNRVNGENFSEISVDPSNDSLRGVLELRGHSSLRIARVQSTAVVLRGGRLNRSSGLLLHLQEGGRSLNEQLGRAQVLRVGDITFCDAGRPYMVRCAAPVRMIVIKTPYELFAKRFGSIEDLVMLQVDGTRGGGAMLASFVRRSVPKRKPWARHKQRTQTQLRKADSSALLAGVKRHRRSPAP